ncbi:hypothetical protein, partial [Hymenobacter lapidarius]|uniref:hypothetical protein n=1 Tax=Hymenobacter lapidarius TaxID=1908237 RepID=UPI00195BCC2A
MKRHLLPLLLFTAAAYLPAHRALAQEKPDFFQLLQEALLHAHVLRDAGNERRKLVDFAEK